MSKMPTGTPSNQLKNVDKSMHYNPEGGDLVIQLMGVLVSLVCDGGFVNVIVGEEWRRRHEIGC